MGGVSTDAETTAAFLIDRLRAARGSLWDEGPGRITSDGPPSGPALNVIATRRVRGVPEAVARGLLAWDRGQRPVDLLFAVPTARDVLERQARGRRCVCLIDDAAARAHGDPRHPDGLTFLLHDLCHLEKFVAPEHHAGQVGFFRCLARALSSEAMRALEREFDQTWRADRDYVSSDMNGSAIFLFAALKMKLNMAVRRRLGDRGGVSPSAGPLTAEEREAAEPALAILLETMALPGELRACARAVSARRDHPAEARRLLAHFEAEGTMAGLTPSAPTSSSPSAASAVIENWKRAPAPLPLAGGVQPYAWGQRNQQAIIPRLLGIAPVPDQPYAELWLGAHPQLPSTVTIDGASLSLIALVTEAPEAVLGETAARRFGAQLPFLMKVLAAAQPLSIQAHPDQAQAEAGFAREEAAGIPRDAPQRSYRDPRHKPELIVALGDLFALKGFRRVEEISTDFIRTPELAPLLRELPSGEVDRDRRNVAQRAWIKELFTRTFSDASETSDAVPRALEALVQRLEAEDRTHPFARDRIEHWLLRAARALGPPPAGGGADRGLLSFYLLNLIHLRAGQALYLGPGELHAYLEGAGVEVMANSDNVLRGGLTPKHVDVPALLATLTFDVGTPTILQARPDGFYATPASEFAVARLTLAGGATVAVDGARGADLLLVTRGEVTLVPAPPSPLAALKAPTGRAFLMPAALGAYQIRTEHSPATLFRATIPL